MRTTTKIVMSGLVASIALAGCVVAPPQPVYNPQPQPVYAPAPAGYVYTQPIAPPPNTVYVQPTYAAPAIGFVWAFHPQFGYGYYHPHHGWARGWR